MMLRPTFAHLRLGKGLKGRAAALKPSADRPRLARHHRIRLG